MKIRFWSLLSTYTFIFCSQCSTRRNRILIYFYFWAKKLSIDTYMTGFKSNIGYVCNSQTIPLIPVFPFSIFWVFTFSFLGFWSVTVKLGSFAFISFTYPRTIRFRILQWNCLTVYFVKIINFICLLSYNY